MDFKGKGHWEMDYDLVGEFIQQQQNKVKKSATKMKAKLPQAAAAADDDEDENEMLMKCLPAKLIDESIVEEQIDPFALKESLSITTLKSKFDENVKAIWNDCNDPAMPMTQKGFYDCGSTASLASSFMSEKNCLSLFNFCEPPPTMSSSSMQYHQHPQNFIEVIAPPPTMYFEMPAASYNQQQPADYDYNNNNPSFFNNGWGAVPLMSDYYGDPYMQQPQQQHQQQCDLLDLCKFESIGSGNNLQSSIWSDGGFASDPECLILRDVSKNSLFIILKVISENFSSIFHHVIVEREIRKNLMNFYYFLNVILQKTFDLKKLNNNLV